MSDLPSNSGLYKCIYIICIHYTCKQYMLASLLVQAGSSLVNAATEQLTWKHHNTRGERLFILDSETTYPECRLCNIINLYNRNIQEWISTGRAYTLYIYTVYTSAHIYTNYCTFIYYTDTYMHNVSVFIRACPPHRHALRHTHTVNTQEKGMLQCFLWWEVHSSRQSHSVSQRAAKKRTKTNLKANNMLAQTITQPNTINQASNHYLHTLTVTPVILSLKFLITTWLLSRGCDFKMPSRESSIANDFQWLVNVKVYVTSTSPVTWSLSRSNVWFHVGSGNVGAVWGWRGRYACQQTAWHALVCLPFLRI